MIPAYNFSKWLPVELMVVTGFSKQTIQYTARHLDKVGHFCFALYFSVLIVFSFINFFKTNILKSTMLVSVFFLSACVCVDAIQLSYHSWLFDLADTASGLAGYVIGFIVTLAITFIDLRRFQFD